MSARRSTLFAFLLTISTGGLAACGAGADEPIVQGSGATFPAPIYKRWFLEYYRKTSNVRVNYSPIGSGAGIRQFTSGLVAFAASDAGISPKEMAKLPPDYGGAVILPMTAGCIVLAYNLPGLERPVRLSRRAYIAIFLREITRWNDDEIAKDNPDVALPNQGITVVTRADSSGTTYAFTTHMAAVAKAQGIDWSPGVDKSVRWKEAISAQGNDGVAALIQLTPGAIGYLEYGYAELAHLPTAALENRAHRFVVADKDGEAGSSALDGAEIPADFQIKIPDPIGEGSYPIVTYTWVLSRRVYGSEKESERLKALFRFCLEDRQQEIATELGYLRMPAEVIARLGPELEKITAKPAPNPPTARR